MKTRKYDNNMELNPVLHLEAESVEEQQFLNKLWFEGARIVSYNGSDKLSLTNASVGQSSENREASKNQLEI